MDSSHPILSIGRAFTATKSGCEMLSVIARPEQDVELAADSVVCGGRRLPDELADALK